MDLDMDLDLDLDSESDMDIDDINEDVIEQQKHYFALTRHVHKHIESLVDPNPLHPLYSLSPALFQELCQAGTVTHSPPTPAPESSPEPDASFPNFCDLPARARHLVWRHACPKRTFRPRHARTPIIDGFHLAPPAVYDVCRESRWVASRVGAALWVEGYDYARAGPRPRAREASWFGRGDTLDLMAYVRYSDTPLGASYDDYLGGLRPFLDLATVVQLDVWALKHLWLEMTSVRFRLPALKTVRVVADFRCGVSDAEWDPAVLDKEFPRLVSVDDDRGAMLREEVQEAYREICKTKHCRTQPRPHIRRPPTDLRNAVAWHIAFARRVVELAWVSPGAANPGLMPRCYFDDDVGDIIDSGSRDERTKDNGVFNDDGTFNTEIEWVKESLDVMPRVVLVVDLGIMDLTGRDEYENRYHWQYYKEDNPHL